MCASSTHTDHKSQSAFLNSEKLKIDLQGMDVFAHLCFVSFWYAYLGLELFLEHLFLHVVELEMSV